MSEDVEAILGPGVRATGGGPEGWLEQTERFLELLRVRNRQVNLVSRKTADEVVRRHALPSLATLRLVPPDTPLRWLDIGSGGGFPGMVLKILRPQVRIDFVEATRKKCEFLEECVEALELADARVHWCRIEKPTEELQERAPFDLAVARAVGSEDRIRQAGHRLLRKGGAVWVFAEPGSGDEVVGTDATGRAVTALKKL